jgi:hypothetical protein
MSASTFRSLLQQTSETVERPRALAGGHYIGDIKSTEFGTSRQKQTPYLRVLITPTEETDDVPVGANDGIDLTRKELRKDFYITPGSLYRLGDMLDSVLGKDGRPFEERIPDLRGQRVLFAVTTRDNDEGTETYNDIGSIVAAKD